MAAGCKTILDEPSFGVKARRSENRGGSAEPKCAAVNGDIDSLPGIEVRTAGPVPSPGPNRSSPSGGFAVTDRLGRASTTSRNQHTGHSSCSLRYDSPLRCFLHETG